MFGSALLRGSARLFPLLVAAICFNVAGHRRRRGLTVLFALPALGLDSLGPHTVIDLLLPRRGLAEGSNADFRRLSLFTRVFNLLFLFFRQLGYRLDLRLLRLSLAHGLRRGWLSQTLRLSPSA